MRSTSTDWSALCKKIGLRGDGRRFAASTAAAVGFCCSVTGLTGLGCSAAGWVCGPGDGPIERMAAVGVADEGLVPGYVTLDRFRRSFPVTDETPLGKAFDAALDTAEPEDSEIQLVVLGVDHAGMERELGTARISLETLVARGTDFLGSLPITSSGTAGGACGELRCEVGGIACLIPMAVAKGRASVATMRNYRSQARLAPIAVTTVVAASRLQAAGRAGRARGRGGTPAPRR